MPRYAVLEHDHPMLHWDFLLEDGDVLLTWRLSSAPRTDGPLDAVKSPDHRRLYLDYEGDVSGGRGAVTRWDSGLFEWKTRETDRIAVRLRGNRLKGVLHLKASSLGEWRGVFHTDSAESIRDRLEGQTGESD